SALVATADDRLFAGGVDGKVREVDRDGAIRGEIAVSTGPITALAASVDGGYIAASSVRGGITLLNAGSLTPVRTLGAAGVPVWSLAFSSDGRTLLAGGADRIVREWDAGTGQQLGTTPEGPADPMAEYAGSPGAEVF